MEKVKPCAVCGEMTSKLLFRDKMLNIPVCSRKCEYEYFRELSPDMKEQIDTVRHLDGKIEQSKRRNRIGWCISCSGLVIIATGFALVSVPVFIAGNATVVSGALSTRHFEDKIRELTKLRMRIQI
jgi:hypothetical protein